MALSGLRNAPQGLRGASIAAFARPSTARCSMRLASTATAEAPASQLPDLLELETESNMEAPEPTEEQRKRFAPWARASKRKVQLPGSRYQYHPPKYDRGPLHPVQSPPSSDPVARDFVPGPFNLPRLRQTFQSTIAADLMTLTYQHKPPGTAEKVIGQRLRGWDGSSPYHKNRPLRAPRGKGGSRLLPVERDVTFRNVPEIKEVTVSTYVPQTLKHDEHLVVARMMLLAITGAKPEDTRARANVAQWGVKERKKIGAKATIRGNAAYEFLDRCIHLVFPRIKEWQGIKGTTGDRTGNIAFGLNPEDMVLFPEIEVNESMYPGKTLPGCRVYVKTTATSNRQARLLMQSLGLPFYGEMGY